MADQKYDAKSGKEKGGFVKNMVIDKVLWDQKKGGGRRGSGRDNTGNRDFWSTNLGGRGRERNVDPGGRGIGARGL